MFYHFTQRKYGPRQDRHIDLNGQLKQIAPVKEGNQYLRDETWTSREIDIQLS